VKNRRFIDNNIFLSLMYDKIKQFYYKNFFTDESLINKKFNKRLGRDANLLKPERYNDKLQWLKLNWYDPMATICADKYEVRKIIKKKIGEQYVNELLGVYESVDDICIEDLPKSFVLKGTHGSGFNIICKDKNKLDWKYEFKKMRRWIRINYYWANREWVYKDIKPRIICEKYMEDRSGKPPKDYKVFCFDGEPKLIQVDIDRFDQHKQNFYDTNWNFRNVEIEKPAAKEAIVEKPEKLEEMLQLSKILTSSFPHARADFYDWDGKIIFGEITFFHHSGMGKFNPPEFEVEMGSYIKLPAKKYESE